MHAFTHPLITKSDGTKFGKSVSGAVWLDPARTSPYQFRQFWMQCDDEMIATYLLMLSMRPEAELRHTIAEHAAAPEKRIGATSARSTELTALVHGDARRTAAEEAAHVLFGGDPTDASAAAFEVVRRELGSTQVAASRTRRPAALLLAKVGLASSNGDARRTIAAERLTGSTGLQLDADADLERSTCSTDGTCSLRQRPFDYRIREISWPRGCR